MIWRFPKSLGVPLASSSRFLTSLRPVVHRSAQRERQKSARGRTWLTGDLKMEIYGGFMGNNGGFMGNNGGLMGNNGGLMGKNGDLMGQNGGLMGNNGGLRVLCMEILVV